MDVESNCNIYVGIGQSYYLYDVGGSFRMFDDCLFPVWIGVADPGDWSGFYDGGEMNMSQISDSTIGLQVLSTF